MTFWETIFQVLLKPNIYLIYNPEFLPQVFSQEKWKQPKCPSASEKEKEVLYTNNKILPSNKKKYKYNMNGH